jgi:hypothetical protein
MKQLSGWSHRLGDVFDAALRYLQQWRKYVELTERVARKGDTSPG